jgi:hypothetical protein
MSGRWQVYLLAGLTAVWPLHALAMALNSEPLFIASTAASLLLLIRSCENGSRTALIAAGLGLGLSAYIRPVNALATLILGCFLLWKRHLTWKRACLFAVTGIITLMPWTIRNARQFHRLIPVAAHFGSIYYITHPQVFYPIMLRSAGSSHTMPVHHDIVGNDLELDLEANTRYWDRSRENIQRDPLGFLWRCLVKTVFVWSYLPGTKDWIYSKTWLFGLGIAVQWTFLLISWSGWRRLRRCSPALANTTLGYAGYTAVILFPFYAESRFLLPVYIWLFALAWYWTYQQRQHFQGAIRRCLTRARSVATRVVKSPPDGDHRGAR